MKQAQVNGIKITLFTPRERAEKLRSITKKKAPAPGMLKTKFTQHDFLRVGTKYLYLADQCIVNLEILAGARLPGGWTDVEMRTAYYKDYQRALELVLKARGLI